MKIIDIETDDIGDFKTIIEILNGFIPEANAEFIKDARAYSESINKKKATKNSDKNDENSQENKLNSIKKNNISNKKSKELNEKNNSSSKKSKEKKKVKKIPKKEKKGKKSKYDDSESDSNCSDTDNNGDSDRDIDSNSDKDDETVEEKVEENRGEIKILTADPNQVMITFIVLKGSAFKKFVVHPEKYSVGLNLDELFKYIKNVDKEGTMSIQIDSDDTQHIIFDVKSENTTSQESICELRVLNLSSRKDRRIEANVSMAVRINCQAFHKACKDLMQFSQFVEITCDPSQLAITCKGDLSNHKRIFKADNTQNGIIIKTVKKEDDDDTPNIIRLVFDLKYINSMYKCSSLCEDMEIYLNTDSVMFLKYGIKIIGEMLVGISPSRKKKEQTDNYDENDDAFYQDDDEIQLK